MDTSNGTMPVLIFWLITILITLILLAGLIVLQVFLSRAKSKIPGLILPISTFVITLLVVLIIVFAMKVPEGSSVAGTILPVAVIGLIPPNIPTLILLLIYFLSRKKLNDDNNQEIKKMTIQDLE